MEVLSHLCDLLSILRLDTRASGWKPKVSTLTAMLLLVGYECRIDDDDEDANSSVITTHMDGLQTMMRLCIEHGIVLNKEIQRALFWQDVISCLLAGSPRFLSHTDFESFRVARYTRFHREPNIPPGFLPHVAPWPEGFSAVVQDLNTLCELIDIDCDDERESLGIFPINDDQANLESRIVDLLSDLRMGLPDCDPVYEACIFALYLCTYKLSTSIWGSCYIPEKCVDQILRCIGEAAHSVHSAATSELIFWLLIVCGGLSERRHVRAQIEGLMYNGLHSYFGDFMRDWQASKKILKRYIWSTYAMESKLTSFWGELHQKAVRVLLK